MIRPIIFSGPMVRAILEGRKTQTRRLATSPLRNCEPGDWLYVRESGAWQTMTEVAPSAGQKRGAVWYAATGEASGLSFFGGKQRPSIHMPRWASRITLRVEAVRVEPLNDIAEEDAIAEGIVYDNLGWHVPGVDHPCKDFPVFSRPTAREMYAALWDVLHGSGEWLGNPPVLVLTFTAIQRNVDRLAA